MPARGRLDLGWIEFAKHLGDDVLSWVKCRLARNTHSELQTDEVTTIGNATTHVCEGWTKGRSTKDK
jgi:hypothetical protein